MFIGDWVARHGAARKLQQENRAGRVQGFKAQGVKKKFANLSTGQLRSMFPMLGHLSDVELKKKAMEELEKRGK